MCDAACALHRRRGAVAILGAAVGLLMATVDLGSPPTSRPSPQLPSGLGGLLPSSRIAWPVQARCGGSGFQHPSRRRRGPRTSVRGRLRRSRFGSEPVRPQGRASPVGRNTRRSRHRLGPLPGRFGLGRAANFSPTQGGSGRGVRFPDAVDGHDPAVRSASRRRVGLELVLNELFIFRSCDGRWSRCPAPDPAERSTSEANRSPAARIRLDLVLWPQRQSQRKTRAS